MNATAEAHVYCSQHCVHAYRSSKLHKVQVPNIAGTVPLSYNVFCDLECVVGTDTINCTSIRGESYSFNVSPQASGTFVGTMSFVAADGQYVWYSLEVCDGECKILGTHALLTPRSLCWVLSRVMHTRMVAVWMATNLELYRGRNPGTCGVPGDHSPCMSMVNTIFGPHRHHSCAGAF